jgi:GNAT superfamily N-acetyltransferase
MAPFHAVFFNPYKIILTMTLFIDVFKGSIDGYQIVPLSTSDEDRIHNFLIECEDYQQLECGRPVQPEDAHAYLFDLPPGKTLDDKFTFSIEKSGQIIALLDILRDYKGENNWWIGLLLILPAMRGLGVGRKILDFLVENMKRNGVKEIRLAVLEENKPGFQFWQKMGFKQIEVVYGRRHGLKIHNLIVMSRALV